MQKFSTPDTIKTIAFDLDGTLYDEFEFISQAYLGVSEIIADYLVKDRNLIYTSLCNKWLQIGSSGNVFQAVAFEIASVELPKEIITQCVLSYRLADIHLSVSRRTEWILDNLVADKRQLFIITDGDSSLQRKKYDALQLNKWIIPEHVFVSGDYGKQFQKPNPLMGELLKRSSNYAGNTLYVGDRMIDKEFAENNGFVFLHVKNMQSFSSE